MALLFEQESGAILGACFEVHNVLGPGFLEPVYQECLQHEFRLRGIPFQPEHKLRLTYKGIVLDQYYKADFLCFEKIVVETKCVSQLVDKHRALTINYLKATNFRLGLLVNFQSYPKLEFERVIR